MAMQPIRGYKAPKRYPGTEHQARHLYRNRHQNGLAPAFAKVGARVVFDPERLDALLSAQQLDPSAA